MVAGVVRSLADPRGVEQYLTKKKLPFSNESQKRTGGGLPTSPAEQIHGLEALFVAAADSTHNQTSIGVIFLLCAAQDQRHPRALLLREHRPRCTARHVEGHCTTSRTTCHETQHHVSLVELRVNSRSRRSMLDLEERRIGALPVPSPSGPGRVQPLAGTCRARPPSLEAWNYINCV